LVIAVVMMAPPVALALVFAALVLAACWEWAALIGAAGLRARVVYVAGAGLLMWLGSRLLANAGAAPTGLQILLGCVVAGWILAAAAIVAYPRGAAVWGSRAALLALGFVLLVPPWLAVLFIRSLPHGEYLVIYAIAVIAFADIGAYFAGRRFGGAKLMPRVSPAKTWAGCCGGMLASVALALLVGLLAGLSDLRLVAWLALALLAAAFSVVGDLLESMVKRHGGQKDSGSLLPGHGGLFDRLDSLTAGLPVLALGLMQAGLFWS
jgi:phosphatidate cytidylyltransferase